MYQSGVGTSLERRELTVDSFLHFGRLHIAHNHNCSELREIPAAVELLEHVGGHTVDLFGCAERHAGAEAVLAYLEVVEAVVLKRAAQFFEYYAFFGFDTLRIYGQAIHPVGYDRKRSVVASGGYRVGRESEEVYGAVVAGERIDVNAVFHAERLKVGHGSAVGEVLRSAEGHVFEEMRASSLRVVLLHGSNVPDESEFGSFSGEVVVEYYIPESVGQRSFDGAFGERYDGRRCCRVGVWGTHNTCRPEKDGKCAYLF